MGTELVSTLFRPLSYNASLIENNSILTNGATSMAHQAFLKAADQFALKLNKDESSLGILKTTASIKDIQKLIELSKKTYEDEKRFPKARKWLNRAASTIHHYSSCIDVFAQVDPVHVSLVWGSMRLVLMVGPKTHQSQGVGS